MSKFVGGKCGKIGTEFEAEILVLYHQTTIQKHYEAVIHCGAAQQCARILAIDKEVIRTGDKATVRFRYICVTTQPRLCFPNRFMSRPEFVTIGTRLIFREGRAKGVGRVVKLFPTAETEMHVTSGSSSAKSASGSGRSTRTTKDTTAIGT